MSSAENLEYEQTETEAMMVAHTALKYIYTGETKGLPLGFRGLNVFSVVAMLREQDSTLHAEPNILT
jgi:hypothetical protein